MLINILVKSVDIFYFYIAWVYSTTSAAET